MCSELATFLFCQVGSNKIAVVYCHLAVTLAITTISLQFLIKCVFCLFFLPPPFFLFLKIIW